MSETPQEQSRRRIGVYDFNSLHAILKDTFERLYPEWPNRDPQDMVQLLEAEILSWRRTGKAPHGQEHAS